MTHDLSDCILTAIFEDYYRKAQNLIYGSVGSTIPLCADYMVDQLIDNGCSKVTDQFIDHYYLSKFNFFTT